MQKGLADEGILIHTGRLMLSGMEGVVKERAGRFDIMRMPAESERPCN